MGGKRTGTGKHLYLCLAGLIVLGSAGCATSGRAVHPEVQTKVQPDVQPEVQPKVQPEVQQEPDHKPVPWLQTMQLLIDRGEYDKAIRKSEELLASPNDSTLSDEALFALGLLSADVKNPRKDYQKSRDYFTRLVKEYPGSEYAGQARIWIGVLDLFEKSKQVDLEIDVKKKGISN